METQSVLALAKRNGWPTAFVLLVIYVVLNSSFELRYPAARGAVEESVVDGGRAEPTSARTP